MDKPIINVRSHNTRKENKENKERSFFKTRSENTQQNDYDEIKIHNYRDKKIKHEDYSEDYDIYNDNEEENNQINNNEYKESSTSIFDKYHDSNYLINRAKNGNRANSTSDDYSNYYEDYLIKKNNSKKHKNFESSKMFKMLLTSVSAVGAGVIIGYFMLHFFTTTIDNLDASKNITTNTQTTDGVITPTNIQVGDGQVIKGRNIYLVQAGVFSNLTGAEAIVSKQQGVGKAAIIQHKDSYYVFVGLASLKEDADVLKGIFVSDGEDVFTKEYLVPEKKFNMSKETFTTFANWANVGEQIVSNLSKQSVLALDNPSYKINSTNLKKLHQQFLLDVQTLKTSLADEKLDKELKLVNDMSDKMYYAISAVNAYEKNPNSKYLWDIQELLMNYELVYSNFN